VFGSASAEELELALEKVVNEALEEVMNSTNLQPSVPGIVCEVISDLVQSVSQANDLVQSVSEATGDTKPTAVNANGVHSNPELASHNAQVCQLVVVVVVVVMISPSGSVCMPGGRDRCPCRAEEFHQVDTVLEHVCDVSRITEVRLAFC